MRVLFVHPDLGIGGAERLIVDTAIAVKSDGHDVSILTNQYDPNHCFKETKDLNIIVKASSLPRQIGGRFHAFFAYLKIFLASLWIIYFSGLKFDVVICDQISLPVLAFKLNKFKVLFYCHFPDKLLCVYDKKRNFLKRIYRLPLDWLELVTTGMSDVILVNSQFTSNIFRDTFPSLKEKKIQVLYPSLNTDVFDSLLNQFQDEEEKEENLPDNDLRKVNLIELQKSKNKKFIFLSINRFERKKDLKLAVNTMDKLKQILDNQKWSECHLVMAGGYDYRVKENVDHYQELRDLAESLGLSANISFMRSISDKQKVNLLRKTFCLLYTPTNEHFGIVPVEAMYCGKPVIATNTGGPLETVAHNTTGYLVSSDAQQFADEMSKLVNEPKIQQSFGLASRARVIKKFSFLSFKKQINDILKEMTGQPNENKKSD